MQRATAFARLLPMLEEFGVGPDAALAGTGLSIDDLKPDSFIPYRAALAFLENAAALTDREDLGLRLGGRQSLASLGPLRDAMLHAETLGEALADFVAFQITNTTGAAVYLHRAEGEFIFGYGIYDAADVLSPQMHDMVLAVGQNLIRELTAAAVRPTGFLSMRSAPSDRTPWESLGAPIQFGQDQTALLLSRTAAGFRLPTANEAAREEALAVLASHMSLAPWGWAGRTRHALRALLLDRRSSMPQVARHLRNHPRSLRRALKKEGTCFEAIKDEVRYAVARELLSLGSLSVGELAMTLDFASPSAFVRAFRRWSGTTPSAWRDARGGINSAPASTYAQDRDASTP